MNLYVGNLSYGLNEDDVNKLFSEYGYVLSVKLIADRDTGRPKGFGFVEMEKQAEGEEAIKQLDGREVDGRNIKVNEARPRN